MIRLPSSHVNRRVLAAQPIQKLRCAIERSESSDVATLCLKSALGHACANEYDERIMLSRNRDIDLRADAKHCFQRFALDQRIGSHLTPKFNKQDGTPFAPHCGAWKTETTLMGDPLAGFGLRWQNSQCRERGP